MYVCSRFKHIKKHIMKKLVTYFGLVILMMITTNAFSQIAISDVSHTADPSAVLDVYSNSLGMLTPRMAVAPSTPATGLLYFNTGINAFDFYDGSNWQTLDIVNPTILSHARVFQAIPNNFGIGGQLIPNSSWTPVVHDAISYDLTGEMVVGNHQMGMPSYFKANESGFYQVNARLDFILYDAEQGEPINNPYSNGYVSIAIFVSTDNGNTFQMYAQGNKLQGADNNSMGDTKLPNNLAPNVSDIIELQSNDIVKIYAWQNLNPLGGTLPLRIVEQNGADPTSRSQVYFSIHKTF
jgi:hypothetical protein